MWKVFALFLNFALILIYWMTRDKINFVQLYIFSKFCDQFEIHVVHASLKQFYFESFPNRHRPRVSSRNVQ